MCFDFLPKKHGGTYHNIGLEKVELVFGRKKKKTKEKNKRKKKIRKKRTAYEYISGI